jgi:hypothetical protein
MYSIKNFTPYGQDAQSLRKHLGNAIVLVWSRQSGYQFMDILDRAKAMADNVDFKIIAVEKD